MGMYIELVMAIELNEKGKADKDVVDILKYMVGDADNVKTLPNHELFRTKRWRYMLRMSSYYFEGSQHTELKYDNILNSYYLTVRCNLKNYDDEIAKFVDWIKPYSETKGFVGYYRYECCKNPTLIYFDDENKERELQK